MESYDKTHTHKTLLNIPCTPPYFAPFFFFFIIRSRTFFIIPLQFDKSTLPCILQSLVSNWHVYESGKTYETVIAA